MKDISIKILKQASKDAGKKVKSDSKKNNIALVQQIDNELVKIYPDGKREVLKKIKKMPKIKVDKRFYI